MRRQDQPTLYKLFDSAAFLCFVLSLALVALWMRSFFVADVHSSVSFDETYFDARDIVSSRGELRIGWQRVPKSIPGTVLVDHRTLPTPFANSGRRLWYTVGRGQGGQTTPFSERRLFTDDAAPELGRPEPSSFIHRRGFVLGGSGAKWTAGYSQVIGVPHWLPLLLLAGIPALWLKYGRPAPREKGLCRTCGYDLRASPEICPECGTRNYELRLSFIARILHPAAPRPTTTDRPPAVIPKRKLVRR